LYRLLVIALGLKSVDGRRDTAATASQLPGQPQAEISRQRVQPRQQQVQLIQHRSQRRHPFGSGRAQLILMEIAVIPPTKITQLKHNLLDWAMMARQQNW
jgi:hypothetical protein